MSRMNSPRVTSFSASIYYSIKVTMNSINGNTWELWFAITVKRSTKRNVRLVQGRCERDWRKEDNIASGRLRKSRISHQFKNRNVDHAHCSRSLQESPYHINSNEMGSFSSTLRIHRTEVIVFHTLKSRYVDATRTIMVASLKNHFYW